MSGAADKPDNDLVVFPLQVTCAFSLETFRIFSLLWGPEISPYCVQECVSVCVKYAFYGFPTYSTPCINNINV